MRSNLPNEDPATLWQYYIRLTEDRASIQRAQTSTSRSVRSMHQTDKRIEAHIFIAFIAYCLP